jgi:hypothetical protein
MPKRVRQMPDGSAVGNIGVHDPFELVRHLARSQSDPRKAVAELVQNALDEQATHITIERTREGAESVLSILDDGLGVLPHVDRKEALTTIATNIGHSRKKQMSFDERMRQAMLGQYGIGLLGFWAVGHELRIISRVADSELWALTLFEDSPRYTITRHPEIIGRSSTFTEVQVLRLHRAAMGPTVGARLASYLSVELRGQLVRHNTKVKLIDRLARGTADKEIVIAATDLAGDRLNGLGPLQIANFKFPAETILHYAGDAGAEAGRVRLACAGAVVLDDISTLPELNHAPWTDERLVGVVDFPHLEIPPGSRRGIVPNAAAHALIESLVALESAVTAKIDERSNADASSLSLDLHKQLAKLFTKVTTFVPHLEWFPVARKTGTVGEINADGTQVSPAEIDSPSAPTTEKEPAEEPELFPPGPLHLVSVKPAKLEFAVGEKKQLVAKPVDDAGRLITDGSVQFEWTSLKPESSLILVPQANILRVECAVPSSEEQIRLVARQENNVRECVVPVNVLAEPAKKTDAGIPQPEEVNEPLQSWRSRLIDEKWQINTGHADYRALAQQTKPRLRYLATLLSKEIVSRNFPQPGIGATLEELVGLLAALERSGAWSGKSKEERSDG